MAPVVEFQGRDDRGPVAGKIGGAEGAARRFQFVRQAAGELALVEVAGAGVRQAPQGPGQGRQRQIMRRRAAARERGQASRQKQTPRRLEEREIGGGDGDGQRPIPVQQHTLLGERDGGLQQSRPGQPAEALMGEADALHIGGKRHGFRPDHIAVLDHPRPAEDILIALGARQQLVTRRIQPRGRHQAEIDHLGRARPAAAPP